MTKITGRPKQAVTREKYIGFTVTKLQNVVIESKAKKAALTISEYMRQVAINSQIKPRWTEEERQLIKQMIARSNDLHQMVLKAGREGTAATLLYFTECRNIMDQLINKLAHDR